MRTRARGKCCLTASRACDYNRLGAECAQSAHFFIRKAHTIFNTYTFVRGIGFEKIKYYCACL